MSAGNIGGPAKDDPYCPKPNWRGNSSPIETIPHELLVLILSNITAIEVVRCQFVCKQWHALCRSQLVWKNRVLSKGLKDDSQNLFKIYTTSFFFTKHLQRYNPQEIRYNTASYGSCVCFDVRYPYLVSGYQDNSVVVYDLHSKRTQSVLSKNAHKNQISSVLIEGQTVYGASTDGVIKAWDIPTKRCTLSINTAVSHFTQIAKHQSHLLASSGEQLICWDSEKGKLVSLIPMHKPVISALSLQRNLLITGGLDKMVKLWDAKKLLTPTAKISWEVPVYYLSQYGYTLAVGGLYHKIALFDTRKMDKPWSNQHLGGTQTSVTAIHLYGNSLFFGGVNHLHSHQMQMIDLVDGVHYWYQGNTSTKINCILAFETTVLVGRFNSQIEQYTYQPLRHPVHSRLRSIRVEYDM